MFLKKTLRIIPILLIGFLIVGVGNQVNDASAVIPAPNIEFQTMFGSYGTGNGEFNIPVDVTGNSTHLVVSDLSNARIQIFDRNGIYKSSFGGAGSGDGQLSFPWGVTMNSTHILVADSGHNRIQIFDLSGTYVAKFGIYGTGDGEFFGPRGIAVTSSRIYVADINNDRVQVFDLTGKYLFQFGNSTVMNSPSGIRDNGTHIFVVASGWIKLFDLNGM